MSACRSERQSWQAACQNLLTSAADTNKRELRRSTPDLSFLEALEAWVSDAPGWYANHGQELPANGDWTFFARALSAAGFYE